MPISAQANGAAVLACPSHRSTQTKVRPTTYTDTQCLHRQCNYNHSLGPPIRMHEHRYIYVCIHNIHTHTCTSTSTYNCAHTTICIYIACINVCTSFSFISMFVYIEASILGTSVVYGHYLLFLLGPFKDQVARTSAGLAPLALPSAVSAKTSLARPLCSMWPCSVYLGQIVRKPIPYHTTLILLGGRCIYHTAHGACG